MNQNIQRTISTLSGGQPPRPMPQPSAAAQTITPKEIVAILRRHVWMIALFTIGGVIIAAAAYFGLARTSSRFTATANIEVLPPINDDPMTFGQGQPQKETYYQFRFTKSALMTQQGMLERLIQQDAIRDTAWFKSFTQLDETGQPTNMAKATLAALGDLQKKMIASAPRDYNFIQLSMTCSSPTEAAKIVDEMVALFINEQRELARGTITSQLIERKSQLAAVQDRLRGIESQLAGIRSGSRFARLNLSENQSFRDYMDDRLGDLENSSSQLESQRASLESIIATLKKRAFDETFDEVVREQMEQDPIALNIRQTIANTEPVLAQQLTRFGSEHRVVKQTQDALARMYDDLAKRQNEIADITRKSNYRSAEDQMTALTQQMDTATKQLQQAQAEYKEIDNIRSTYALLENKRKEELKLVEEMNTYIEKLNSLYMDPLISKMQSLGRAAIPNRPSFPKFQLFLPAGFMLGLLAGLGLAFAVELTNDLLRSPSDVGRHLRSPLLGTICHADDDKDAEGVELSHIVRQAPYTIISECYRQLRANLKMSGASGEEHKTLLITSPGSGDGKTCVAINLANTMLAENKKVLLIDANFRRPTAGHLFPRTKTNGSLAEHADYGLSNYLMGQCVDAKDILRPSGIEGLDVVDSGPLPANPAELLDSPRMKQLLDQCRQRYDNIIIDGPALLVSDAKILAGKADGTLLVFNADGTRRGAAQRILRELQDVRANTVGTVLMGVKSLKGGYFREIYRSYQEYQRVQLDQPM